MRSISRYFISTTLSWVCAAALFAQCCQPSKAAPISLNAAQFSAAAAGSATVEDFEGFATGNTANPFVFANGRFSAVTPRIINSGTFGPTNRLIDNASLSSTRTLDLFPAGTTLVGLDILCHVTYLE